MLRLSGGQVETLFDLGLPIEVREPPADPAALDRMLCGTALLEPIARAWDPAALASPRPTANRGKVQPALSGRAGDPPGKGQVAPAHGLGHDRPGDPKANGRRPAQQVVGQAREHQPGGVGEEPPRGAVSQARALLQVADRQLDHRVGAMIGDRAAMASPSRSVTKARWRQSEDQLVWSASWRTRRTTRRSPSWRVSATWAIPRGRVADRLPSPPRGWRRWCA